MPETTTELSLLSPELVAAQWVHIEPFIARIINAGLPLYTTSHVRDFMFGGKWQCWTASRETEITAVMATEIVTYPLARMLCIYAIAGDDMPEWLGHLDAIEQWANGKGCTIAQIYGRTGWKRILPDYQCERFVMRKAL